MPEFSEIMEAEAGATSHVGDKIKRLRSFRGMTCAELAEAIGCTRPYLSAVENGRYPASTKILKKLQKVLNVEAEYFTKADEPELSDTRRYLRDQLAAGDASVDVDEAGEKSHFDLPSGAQTRQIPFVALSPTGRLNVDFDEYPSGNTDMIDCPGDLADVHAFAVRVDGDIMWPLIPPGAMCVLAPNLIVRENRPAFARLLDGEIVLGLYHAYDSLVILAPANHQHAVRVIPASRIEWIYPAVRVVVDLYNTR